MKTLEKKLATNPQVRRQVLYKLAATMAAGFWWCLDCERVTERIEDDHGQPAHCTHCGSHHLQNQPGVSL